MARKKYTTLDDFSEIYQKYIFGYQLDTDEGTALRALFAKRPDIKKDWDAKKSEWSSSGKAKQASAEQNARMSGVNGSRLRSKMASASYTALPGLNRNVQTQSYGYGRVVSPGGFKASGRDEDSQIRRAGIVTEQGTGMNEAEIFIDGSAEFNGRKYSPSQVMAMIKRGRTGATMGLADQSIYDRYMTIRRENVAARKQAEEEDLNREKSEALIAKANEEKRRENQKSAINRLKALAIGNGMSYSDYLGSLGLDDETAKDLSAEELTAHEEVLKRRNAALDEQAKLKAKTEYENEVNRRQQNEQYGFPDDTPILSAAQLKEINNGTKAWARDPKAVKYYEDQKSEIERMMRDGEINGLERVAFLEELDKKIGEIPYGYIDNPNRRTVRQKRKEAEENNGYYTDDDNSLQYMDLQKADREKEKLELLKERQELAKEKAANAPGKARSDAAMKALLAEKKRYEVGGDKEDYDFDQDAFLKGFYEAYDKIYGTTQPPAEEAPQPSMDDLSNVQKEENAQSVDGNAEEQDVPARHVKKSYL